MREKFRLCKGHETYYERKVGWLLLIHVSKWEVETIAHEISSWSITNDPMVKNESPTMRTPIQNDFMKIALSIHENFWLTSAVLHKILVLEHEIRPTECPHISQQN